ncbi:hypothetical protein ELJ16_30375 [Klebsiella pneumoniae]|nr:hypothetical protein [Klebsiella pneumoniae]
MIKEIYHHLSVQKMESRSLKIAFFIALLAISFGFEASEAAVGHCNVNSNCAKYHYNCKGECINYYCAGHTCYCTCRHAAGDKLTLVTLND